MALLCRNCFSRSQLPVLPARLLLKARNTLEANLPHASYLCREFPQTTELKTREHVTLSFRCAR